MFEKNHVVKTVFEKFRELEDGLSEPTTSPTAPVGHGYARQSVGGGGKALLARSTVLRIHGLVVMNAIDEIISSLDETSEVIELILEQGRSHARFGDSLTEDVFWVGLLCVKTRVKKLITPCYFFERHFFLFFFLPFLHHFFLLDLGFSLTLLFTCQPFISTSSVVKYGKLCSHVNLCTKT